MTLRTRAAVVEKAGLPRPYSSSRPVTVRDLELLGPLRNEVLIRVEAAGLCHSDLALVEGVRRPPLPIVLGHECAGSVVEVGEDVKSVRKGDRVVLSFAQSCGECVYCLSGRPTICDPGRAANYEGKLVTGGTRFRLDGKEVHHHLGVSAFSEHIVVPASSAIPVVQDVPFEKLALFGCAIPTAFGAVFNVAKVRLGSSVAIFGCGGLGLNLVQAARIAGASQIISVDIREDKLRKAELLGATDLVDASKQDPVSEVKRLTAGRGAEYCFEATGVTRVMLQAFMATRKGGTTVILGVTSAEDRVELPTWLIMGEERLVVGSYMGSIVPRRDIPLLLNLYAQGKIRLEEVITGELRLDELNEGLDRLADGVAVRQIVKMR
ncbi:MAG: alcohol dehydrogenase catalytic domain-containing protein [Nitrososphaerota archaeon]|nr:alcohol dehydrogenase catalytic domain-containing protein [Candidatus Calditenuaceae archaeon]MDW8073686.1 alcohol dehydrogenase catalytic domain-containing protein [Nitrososphaerota archaeon]